MKNYWQTVRPRSGERQTHVEYHRIDATLEKEPANVKKRKNIDSLIFKKNLSALLIQYNEHQAERLVLDSRCLNTSNLFSFVLIMITSAIKA